MEEEYVIINKTAVLKRMERLEEFVKSISDSDDSYEFVKLGIEDVLSKSIPLIPEIEKALKVSIPICSEHTLDEVIKITEDYQKWYISNLKLDI